MHTELLILAILLILVVSIVVIARKLGAGIRRSDDDIEKLFDDIDNERHK